MIHEAIRRQIIAEPMSETEKASWNHRIWGELGAYDNGGPDAEERLWD